MNNHQKLGLEENDSFTKLGHEWETFNDEFESGNEVAKSNPCHPFTPVAVESLGGKRIQDKRIPNRSDIVEVQGAFAKTPLHRLAAVALSALVCSARADGLQHPLLLPTGKLSGFRTPKQQESLRKSSEKLHGSKDLGKWVAKPGSSAHQSGRAIDFYLGLPNRRLNVDKLRKTPAFKWMKKNARRFGFYPWSAEPWHWEYNPAASRQPEIFAELGGSFEYESDIEDENDSFEYEGDAVNESDNREYESALNVLSPSELKAVKITSTFETGRPGSFGGLTGNFDGQGLSFGLMNFTIKAGSLIPLLQDFIKEHPVRYARTFGKDAERFKEIVFATKPDPKDPRRRVRDVERQMMFVNTQMNQFPKKVRRNKIIEPWKTYFGHLENDPEFRKIQVKAVRRAMNRARDWFNHFGFKTERGFAFMFDLVSSHGGAWLNAPKFQGKRRALLQKMLADKKASLGRDTLTEREKMEVIANMIADVSLPEWRKKVRIRKMWFVRGGGEVHGKSYDIRKDFDINENAPDFGSSTSASEAEWEANYGSDRLEFEQSTTSVPKLFRQPEKSSHGETIYVKIGIGKGLPATTGIYVPNSFKPDLDTKLVLYLHGHKGKFPGNDVFIRGYWNGTRFPFFALREEVAASGKNVIFVAPSLGSTSQPGSLVERGGFDAFVKQVLSGLNEHYLAPRYGRRMSDVQSIILAAHSGGGSPMLKIATGKDQYAKKIKECWCFDAMYGWVVNPWITWSKSHPQSSLYIYYGPSKGYKNRAGKYVASPRDNAESIACEVKSQGLKNVCVQPSRAKTIGKVSGHFWVPKAHLKERLSGRPCLAGDVCPKGRLRTQSEFEVPASVGTMAGFDVSKLRSNIVQIANQEWQRWNTPGKKFERDTRVRQILLDYWHNGPQVKVNVKDLGSKTWQARHPWSAAFISWVMQKAGAGRAFSSSSAHAAYIKAAKDNRMANNANPFKAFRVGEVKPAVGDLVCKSRANSGATYENIRRGMKTHCDIVTEVQPGRLTTIGGNVSNSVSKTPVSLDSNGYINDKRYFAVIKVASPSS